MIRKLNWRLITIHLIALSFLGYAVSAFVLLSDFKFLVMVSDWATKGMKPHDIPNFSVDRWYTDLLHIQLAKIFAPFLGFAVSLAIVRKRRWFWVNSLFALLLTYTIVRFSPYDPVGVFGHLLNVISLHKIDRAIITGCVASILFVLSILLLFSPYSNKFISLGAFKNEATNTTNE